MNKEVSGLLTSKKKTAHYTSHYTIKQSTLYTFLPVNFVYIAMFGFTFILFARRCRCSGCKEFWWADFGESCQNLLMWAGFRCFMWWRRKWTCCLKSFFGCKFDWFWWITISIIFQSSQFLLLILYTWNPMTLIDDHFTIFNYFTDILPEALLTRASNNIKWEKHVYQRRT